MARGKAGMEMSSDAKIIAAAVVRDLDLTPPAAPTAYYSVTLCAIDAVYSINARYEQVKQVVERYCVRYGLKRHRNRNDPLPPRSEQDAVSDLLARMRSLGDAKFAEDVFQHRGRTSPKNGILKAAAVRRFAEALADHGVEHLQDVPHALLDNSLERAIKRVPGQRSGISLKYFFMEAGCDNLIKPDRMIGRYLESVLSRVVKLSECQPLLSAAVAELRGKFPHLTPRLLDGQIWAHERRRTKAQAPIASSCHSPVRLAESDHAAPFWEAVRQLRRCNRIPGCWNVADILPFLRDNFSDNAIRTIPFNQSMTKDGKTKGDYVKRGRPAQAYRVGAGLFQLIHDPSDVHDRSGPQELVEG